jgi:hemerythrin-like domain-containing protein
MIADPPAAASPADTAIALIGSEHRAIARTLDALEQVTAEIADARRPPDYALMSTILAYLDTFPARRHHPLEGGLLFPAIRRRTTTLDATLGALEADHARGPATILALERALVHAQGGVPDAVARYTGAVAAFCASERRHMEIEDTEILPAARRLLEDTDWAPVIAAFGANEDPVFGARRAGAFDKLFRRIVNLAPRRVRQQMTR